MQRTNLSVQLRAKRLISTLAAEISNELEVVVEELTCCAKPDDFLRMHLKQQLDVEALRTSYGVVVLEVEIPVAIPVSAGNEMEIWKACQYRKTFHVNSVNEPSGPLLARFVARDGSFVYCWALLTEERFGLHMFC